MVSVVIPTVLRGLCGGAERVEVAGGTVESVLRAVDARCAGFYERVVTAGALRPELAFAIDGEVIALALHDPIAESAQIAIVPAIAGGSGCAWERRC